MAAVVAEDLTELSCVLIPLDGTRLLLPNISVAEILPWRRVKVLADGTILLEDETVTVEQLKESLTSLKQVNGVVWYYRENVEGDME